MIALIFVIATLAGSPAKGQTTLVPEGPRVLAAAADSRAVQDVPPRAPAQPEIVPAPPEIVAEVRVHGNHTTPDQEILRLAGIAIGDPVQSDTLARIEQRLRDAGRFISVRVLKRYRSITDTRDVAIVLLIEERGTSSDVTGVLAPVRPFRDRLLFLPILNYADGYGWTYGARGSFVDVLGDRGRVSVPLTWGGVRRAALEIDKPFRHGPFSRVEGTVSISQRENPFYRLDDRRVEVSSRIERAIGPVLRAGARLGWTDVDFSDLQDRFVTIGADLTLDTRADPTFPRNAVLATVGWDRLGLDGEPGVNRYRADARGFVGLIGQSVLSVRGQYAAADGPLPPYEQWLLGGASTLRGYRAGSFVGDNLAAVSAEVRAPLTSRMKVGKLGVSVFADSGVAYPHGQHLKDASFRTGVGGGIFLIATVLQVNLDIARAIDGGTRVHFSSGFTF